MSWFGPNRFRILRGTDKYCKADVGQAIRRSKLCCETEVSFPVLAR